MAWSIIILAISTLALTVSATTTNSSDKNLYIGPIITPRKTEIVLQKGDNYTLSCKGYNLENFTQQDVPEEIIGNFKSEFRYANITDDEEYDTELFIDLYNVDQYAIGYYACSDKFADTSVLNNLVEEPENNEHVSYIYIYVNGTGSLFAPMREIIIPKSDKVVIECRPTTPDVQVNLTAVIEATKRFSPKVGFIFDNDLFNSHFGLNMYICTFKRNDKTEEKEVFVQHSKPPPSPKISYDDSRFIEGETFSINCTVSYEININVRMTWKYPEGVDPTTVIETTNTYSASDILYRSITIVNATKIHAGVYTCNTYNNRGNLSSSCNKKYLPEPILSDITKTRDEPYFESQLPRTSRSLKLDSYPPATYYLLKNNERIPEGSKKYYTKYEKIIKQVQIIIEDTNVTDTANYTLVATNRHLHKNGTLDIRIWAKAEIVEFEDKTCVLGTTTTLICKALGYRTPEITWVSNGTGIPKEYKSTKVDVHSLISVTAYLDIPCKDTLDIECRAVNKVKEASRSDSVTRKILVYEMINGFGINSNRSVWYNEGSNVSIQCLASKYQFIHVAWDSFDKSVDSENEFSLISTLKINNIRLNESGVYECRGNKTDGTSVYETVEINVAAKMAPILKETATTDRDKYAYPSTSVQFHCEAEGVPLPEIRWFKDGELIKNFSENGINWTEQTVNRSIVNSTIFIDSMKQEYAGTYECVVLSDDDGSERKITYSLVMKGEIAITNYAIAIAVIILLLIILVAYLTWKVKKEKQFRRELAAAGLLYFKEGVTKSLNPQLGIDEQAELLPYDDRFEFPADKLKLGIKLGAGAFGVVYKAEARGIINAEETTPVAVKMVVKTADNMYIKALASELKIMVHLGKHINIVNLLGACTKNVGKRELAVIVEYCEFGNIHNYIFRHRGVFIDQLTDSKEKSFGKVNQGFSYTGSTGAQSDYFGCTNTQETDHTFVNSANTNRSGRKNMTNNQPTETKASEGYMQPEWRSNYESDYSYEGRTLRPLTSRDLLAWSFQIARGMEYLASRKVLHGDLAARNVLLAQDNIVKICDFGLARSIYKNDEYQKKENSPLPVKWLAIECMTDRIFSTQSDVWSFGIVLWELFSLAKTPYPNISPANLLQFLSEGHRLDKPTYADDRIYQVMQRCWEQKPNARPSFTQLQELLGTFLEDNVRNHYIDLNSSFMDKNAKAADQEDYLAMVSAPDYNNMVTPSPHHYMNDARSFFPPSPAKVDDEGYLQMSPASNPNIFSPRGANTKFDFDPRKFNPRPSEASSVGSELTPMLALNNLPTRSGSESDHEGNASPYLNMCSKIDEETDEVFDDTKQNNARNHATNLMYITLDKNNEKIPNNNYVNINVSGSLVN